MGASTYRFRVEARSRWPSWLGVALLLGAFGGAALTGATGARRTETAYVRFERAHRAADMTVEDFIPNPDVAVVTHAQVAATGGIADANTVRSYGVNSFGLNGADPDATRKLLQAKGDPGLQVVATPDGRAYGSDIDRLKVLKGRLPDPARTDEVAIDFTFPLAAVGEHLNVAFDRALHGDSHQIDQASDPLAITLTVVGVVAAPGQFPPQNPNTYYTGASAYATPAFFRAHATDLAALEIDLVRRLPGMGMAAVESNVETLGKGKPVAVQDPGKQSAEVRRSTHLESVALWILSGLVGAVGILVLGHVLARMASLEASDTPTMRALGMSRGQVFALGMLRTVCVGVAGALVAALVAVALSPLTPIGLARTAEPNPGLSLNWAVLGLGACAVLVGCLLAAVVPLWRSTAVLSAHDESSRARPPATVARLARWGAPPAATCGVWMALERGRGRTAVPVRSTLAGAVIGIAALAGAVTIGTSLTNLLHNPALFGVNWDADVLNNNGPDGMPAAEPLLKASSDVESAAYRYSGLTVQLNGNHLTEGVIFIPVKADLGPVIVEGRAPADGEVALGTRTMDSIHSHIGDTVRGTAENPDASPVALHVVGRAVLPPGQFVGRLGVGVVVNQATLLRMAGVANGFNLRRPYIISVRFRPGLAKSAATGRLTAALNAVDPQFSVQSPPQPNDLVNFGRIQNLPVILAALLGFLATATLAHLLVSSVRRRRSDLAMLKTLGFDRGQIRRTVAWQATTLGLFAAVVGIPLGVASGRISWNLLSGGLGTVSRPVSPTLFLVLLVPATILLANAVAALPAVFAARVRPAVALRAE
jgi:ABC-type lipoprotein release transport system permease subunit